MIKSLTWLCCCLPVVIVNMQSNCLQAQSPCYESAPANSCLPYRRYRFAPYAEVAPSLPIRFTMQQAVVVRRPESAFRSSIQQEMATESGADSTKKRLDELETNISQLSHSLNDLTKVVQALVDGQKQSK